jgi:TRAP-type uncharacterized transport system substrate-binding protein
MIDRPARGDLSSRLRMMLGHTWLLLTAAALVCLGVAAIAYMIANQPLTLTIAVGPESSEDVRIVRALSAQLGRDRSSIQLKPIITTGTEESAALFDKRTVDLAVVRRDVAMPRDGQAVAILRRNVVVLFAPSPQAAATAKHGRQTKAAKAARAEKAEPIETIEELSGRRLGVVGRSKANVTLLEAILKQYGIPADKVHVETIKTDDLTPIKEGKVDAVMTVGPVGSRITADAIIAAMRGKEPPTFLTIGAAEAIAERNPIYESAEILAGAFGGSPPQPEESLDTIGVSHFIVANRSLSEQTIGELARLLYSMRQTVAAEVPAAAKIEAPETGKDSVITVHPGAAAYIDGTQRNFFDRYSDFIYLGVMLLSFAGTGVAGLVSFSKAGERAQRVDVIERLVAMIANARAARTGAEIDTLSAEADGMLKTTLQQAEKGGLNESALAAFTLALNQARQAIAERRGMLGAAPAGGQ